MCRLRWVSSAPIVAIAAPLAMRLLLRTMKAKLDIAHPDRPCIHSIPLGAAVLYLCGARPVTITDSHNLLPQLSQDDQELLERLGAITMLETVKGDTRRSRHSICYCVLHRLATVFCPAWEALLGSFHGRPLVCASLQACSISAVMAATTCSRYPACAVPGLRRARSHFDHAFINRFALPMRLTWRPSIPGASLVGRCNRPPDHERAEGLHRASEAWQRVRTPV
jgi:hypothetical protein